MAPSNPTNLQSLEQLKTLASPVRQTIWHLVTLLEPVAPHTLQKHMGLERHALYYHLRLLEKCGLITKIRENGTSVAYKTEANEPFLQHSGDEDFQAVSQLVAMTCMRRLQARLESAMAAIPAPGNENIRYLSGFITLFLDEEGRQELRKRLNEVFDELLESRHVPKEGEKPYFFGYGFAPESYGHD